MNINRAKQLQITAPDKKPAYGGDQGWFSSNTRAQGGCSSIAGANALRALFRTNPSFRHHIRDNRKMPRELKDALISPNPDKDSFEELMTGIYNTMGAFVFYPLNLIYDRVRRDNRFFSHIRPNQGQTNSGFIFGIIRFARKFGINLSVKSIPAAFLSKEKAVYFIKEGLRTSGAVVLLTSYNKHSIRLYNAASDLEQPLDATDGWDSSVKCHFTTITDIDGDRLLITTWGKPAVIDLNELVSSWQSIKAFESTLMYVTLSDRSESNRCLLNSWKIFFLCILRCIVR